MKYKYNKKNSKNFKKIQTTSQYRMPQKTMTTIWL